METFIKNLLAEFHVEIVRQKYPTFYEVAVGVQKMTLAEYNKHLAGSPATDTLRLIETRVHDLVIETYDSIRKKIETHMGKSCRNFASQFDDIENHIEQHTVRAELMRPLVPKTFEIHTKQTLHAYVLEHLKTEMDGATSFRKNAYRKAYVGYMSDPNYDFGEGRIAQTVSEWVSEYVVDVEFVVGQGKTSVSDDNVAKLLKIGNFGSATVGKMVKFFEDKGGLPTPEELLKGTEYKLTAAQTLQLSYYKDITVPIQRPVLEKLNTSLAGLGVVVGSFRRGKPETKDLDILFIDKTCEEAVGILTKKCGVSVLGVLTQGETQSALIVKIPGRTAAVHLDVFTCKKPYLGSALLHYTGSAAFNIAVRKHVKATFKHKYKDVFLSQNGIQCETLEGERIIHPLDYTSEKSLMTAIGLEYVAPEDRSSGIIAART